MTKKLLISVLMSVGIVAGSFGIAYAVGTFSAIQQGFRQAGEGQAARVTMQVEAGTADGNSDFLPDSAFPFPPGPGGALDFAITNTSDFPIRVTQIAQSQVPCGLGAQCASASSNKNTDGTYAIPPLSGTCVNYLLVTPPSTFANWPTIGPHSTLHVNGTDNNQLGAGMVHLTHDTPNGCQGALFAVGLNVTATEVTGESSASGPLT
jgi:hypothetical protein